MDDFDQLHAKAGGQLIAQMQNLRRADATPFGTKVVAVSNRYIARLIQDMHDELIYYPTLPVFRFRELQMDALHEAARSLGLEGDSPAGLNAYHAENKTRVEQSSYMDFLREPENHMIDADGGLRTVNYCAAKKTLDRTFRERVAVAGLSIDAAQEITDFEMYATLEHLSHIHHAATEALQAVLAASPTEMGEQEVLEPETEVEGNSISYREVLGFAMTPQNQHIFLNPQGMERFGDQMEAMVLRNPRTAFAKEIAAIIDGYIDTVFEYVGSFPLFHVSQFPVAQGKAGRTAFDLIQKSEKVNEDPNQAIADYQERMKNSAYIPFLKAAGIKLEDPIDVYFPQKRGLDKKFIQAMAGSEIDAAQQIKDYETYMKLQVLQALQNVSAETLQESARPLKQGKAAIR